MIFPNYADLGTNISRDLQYTWQEHLERVAGYRHYYSGDIFQEKTPPDAPPEEQILAYPVGLNLVKMLCLAQTDAMFGECDEKNLVMFSQDTEDDPSEEAVKFISGIFKNSNLNSSLWEAELDRNVYGGAVFKIIPSIEKKGFIRWQKVPVDSFYPVFDPDDPNELLEVYVVTSMSREQARIRYGISTNEETVTRVEHWTLSSYENKIDGMVISAYSGRNPWGFIPFVYIPRVRTSNYYGDAMTPEIIPAQDELNMRLADIGEAVNYNAHPVRWGFNISKAFKSENFPVGPNEFWDLGRVIGNSPEPKLGILEAQHAVKPEVFTYLSFVYDWARFSNFAPPIVFGQDDGSQRSGETLQIRMMPLVRAVRRSRIYLTEALYQIVSYTGRILTQKQFPGISKQAIDVMINRAIHPVYAETLPKDHQQVVDEVVKLLSTEPKAISLETAQRVLGRDINEVEKIKNMLDDDKLIPEEKSTQNNGQVQAVQGKMTPQAEE